MSEFSARPFVAGSLVGLRAFAVDRMGRLVGPSYGQVFTPFENQAECRRREADYRAFWPLMSSVGNVPLAAGGVVPAGAQMPVDPGVVILHSTDEGWRTEAELTDEQRAARLVKLKADREALEAERKAKHQLAGVDCECGFYAYFNGRNDFAEYDGTVSAIVEGYGVCTVGTAGFRASKARLLALVEPGHAVPWLQVRRNYPDVPRFEDQDDALAAFPLTTDHLPSPDDADFWTRSTS